MDDHLLQRNQRLRVRERSRAIGRELRRRYENTLNEDAPEDMIELLRQIDRKNLEERIGAWPK